MALEGVESSRGVAKVRKSNKICRLLEMLVLQRVLEGSGRLSSVLEDSGREDVEEGTREGEEVEKRSGRRKARVHEMKKKNIRKMLERPLWTVRSIKRGI